MNTIYTCTHNLHAQKMYTYTQTICTEYVHIHTYYMHIPTFKEKKNTFMHTFRFSVQTKLTKENKLHTKKKKYQYTKEHRLLCTYF